MSLQAGCHQECINSNIERCVVGWPDGGCGGRTVGAWSPALEREAQSRITATTTQSASALIRENVEGARR